MEGGRGGGEGEGREKHVLTQKLNPLCKCQICASWLIVIHVVKKQSNNFCSICIFKQITAFKVLHSSGLPGASRQCKYASTSMGLMQYMYTQCTSTSMGLMQYMYTQCFKHSLTTNTQNNVRILRRTEHKQSCSHTPPHTFPHTHSPTHTWLVPMASCNKNTMLEFYEGKNTSSNNYLCYICSINLPL